MKKICRYSQI